MFMFMDSQEGTANMGYDAQYALPPDQAKVVQTIYEKLVHEDWSLDKIAQDLDGTEQKRFVLEGVIKGEDHNDKEGKEPQ